MKSKLILSVRLIVLALLYFICFAAVSSAFFQMPAEQASSTAANSALALLIVSCLNTVVLAYVIIRSRWRGWKLVVGTFFIVFGISTVMPQIETAFFITRLPSGILPRILLSGAITAALFSLFAALLLAKIRGNGTDKESLCLKMSASEWVWRLSLIVVAYVAIYFTFGYFIAWKSPAVRAYYGGTDPGSFLNQMVAVLQNTPWLLPLQVLRALLWTGLAALVIRIMKGRWWEIGLAVALLFSILMNAQLLIPNPFMPSEVRLVHLLETAPSNFLFGWLVVWVLCGRRLKQNFNQYQL